MHLNKLSASSSGSVRPVIIWMSLPGLLILNFLAMQFLIICISFSSSFVYVAENSRCNEYSSNRSFWRKSSRKWVYLLFSRFKRFYFATLSFFLVIPITPPGHLSGFLYSFSKASMGTPIPSRPVCCSTKSPLPKLHVKYENSFLASYNTRSTMETSDNS